MTRSCGRLVVAAVAALALLLTGAGSCDAGGGTGGTTGY